MLASQTVDLDAFWLRSTRVRLYVYLISTPSAQACRFHERAIDLLIITSKWWLCCYQRTMSLSWATLKLIAFSAVLQLLLLLLLQSRPGHAAIPYLNPAVYGARVLPRRPSYASAPNPTL